MLKKHIRTHTDVRPYHCAYCNFSFKTKDEKQRFSYERSGYDLEESDGPDEDENENEEEDEDSQAESVLSAAPSATASPQHLPARSGLQDAGPADEDGRIPDCFPGGHTDPMDVLPRALPTKMTVLGAVPSDCSRQPEPAAGAPQPAAQAAEAAAAPPEAAPRSPCHQMSVDYPDPEGTLRSPVAGESVALTQGPSVLLPPPGAERSPQTGGPPPSMTSPQPGPREQKHQITLPPPPGLPSPQTHLFSHLPLHSQQQSRTPYNMVPVGGIQVVPAGLTYSTFVPIQAGPMQLTIPAVNVIHRTVGAPGDLSTDVSGPTNPAGVAELSSVVPCIPIGQIRVPGLQNLSAPALQPLPSLSMETVNIVGLANRHLGPQARPPGLALNAVGLQVLTASPPSQSSPAPQASIPGLQILNIALPALIPSVSQVPADAQGTPGLPAPPNRAREAPPQQPQAAGAPQGGRTASPQGSPPGQRENASKAPDPPAPAREHARLDGSVSPAKPQHELPAAQGKPASAPEPPPSQPPAPRDRAAPRAPAPPRRQPATQFSDVSSDDDEDRLVIAT
uniref:HIVEP zinc finger 1 n=1 Tax=Catagonus wagneri TaxID=51154 RepID=A0A8C3XBJ6_9CETA